MRLTETNKEFVMENFEQYEIKEKKKGGAAKFFKAVFVHNIGLKILSVVLGAALVILAVAL